MNMAAISAASAMATPPLWFGHGRTTKSRLIWRTTVRHIKRLRLYALLHHKAKRLHLQPKAQTIIVWTLEADHYKFHKHLNRLKSTAKISICQ
jgi:hypothetical protein